MNFRSDCVVIMNNKHTMTNEQAERLCEAIVRQALRDFFVLCKNFEMQKHLGDTKESIISFFTSAWGVSFCKFCGLSSKKICDFLIVEKENCEKEEET